MADQLNCAVWMVTYNHAQYIVQAIENVLTQNTKYRFRLFIGDDHSTDGTTEICEKYAREFPDKVSFFPSEKNQGATANGIRMYKVCFESGADFIALCEGDDFWTDNSKLDQQLDILYSDPTLVACHHWQTIAKKQSDGTFQEQPAPKEDQGYFNKPRASVADIFANRLRIKTRTNVFRNIFRDGEQLPEWFYTVKYGDVPFSMILGKHGDFAFIDRPMAAYRMTNSGISSVGRSDDPYFLNHNLEWIRLWELGNREHGEKYNTEAVGTILYFYLDILRKYKHKLSVFRKLLHNHSHSLLRTSDKKHIRSALWNEFIWGRFKNKK